MSKTNKTTLPKALESGPEMTQAEVLSRAALSPSINAVTVIKSYQGNLMGPEVDFNVMVDGLRETVKDVKGGDLSNLEGMLVCQATALQTMFTSLARRAERQEHLKQFNTFMVLALKAQAQSRATISALVELKHPKQATFVQQANIAHGPQQVNNGQPPRGTPAPTHAEETKTHPPELLEEHHGERLDTRATSKASGDDPHLETVATVNRPQVARGQGEGGTKR